MVIENRRYSWMSEYVRVTLQSLTTFSAKMLELIWKTKHSIILAPKTLAKTLWVGQNRQLSRILVANKENKTHALEHSFHGRLKQNWQISNRLQNGSTSIANSFVDYTLQVSAVLSMNTIWELEREPSIDGQIIRNSRDDRISHSQSWNNDITGKDRPILDRSSILMITEKNGLSLNWGKNFASSNLKLDDITGKDIKALNLKMIVKLKWNKECTCDNTYLQGSWASFFFKRRLSSMENFIYGELEMTISESTANVIKWAWSVKKENGLKWR